MIQKLANPILLFILAGAFLGYFILPELMISLFNISIDKGLGAVIGTAVGYFAMRFL